MADLKPCPFCGGEVKIIPEQVDARTESYNFVCQNGDCCANVYFDYSNREEAIEAWNTRKPMEAVVAKLENIKTGGDCRHKCKNYDWSVGSCEGHCEDYVRERAISIVRGKE